MVKVKRSSSEISSSSDTAVDILNSSCDNVSEHKPAKKQKKAEVKGEKPDSPGKYQKRVRPNRLVGSTWLILPELDRRGEQDLLGDYREDLRGEHLARGEKRRAIGLSRSTWD